MIMIMIIIWAQEQVEGNKWINGVRKMILKTHFWRHNVLIVPLFMIIDNIMGITTLFCMQLKKKAINPIDDSSSSFGQMKAKKK